ncbi:MAG: hypothetical protein H6737_11815 [Alphaproteobacteria bacterium]|nr:hypothetical protein [Alphaproteobacteria bacterium]
MSPSRREALLLLAGVLATTWGCGGPPQSAYALADWLPPEAAALGRAWLAAHPESDEALLVALIGSAESVPPDAKERVERQIREELARGELVDVEGWRVGPTECRLCAVIHRAS